MPQNRSAGTPSGSLAKAKSRAPRKSSGRMRKLVGRLLQLETPAPDRTIRARGSLFGHARGRDHGGRPPAAGVPAEPAPGEPGASAAHPSSCLPALRRARASIRGLSRRAHRILGTRVVWSERDAAACGVRRAREAVSRRDHATTTSEQKRETDERLDPSPRRILVARPVSRSTTRHRNPFDVNQ